VGCVNGHFSTLFCRTAESFGVQIELLEFPYGAGVSAARIGERLQNDSKREIKAVLVVHNETSTGVTSDIAAIRQVLDYVRHPALLLIDSVSSVASMDFRFDEWRVDVALAGAQKGLMLPPGLAILAIGARALEASQSARCPRSFWDWGPILERNRLGEFPTTPATAHFFGLKESLAILEEEGLANVFRRHARLAESCRRAVQAIGLQLLARNAAEYSNTLTAVCMPEGFDSDAFVAHAHKRLNFSLGIGLGKVKGTIFRIGHLGSLNEIELLGALAGVEIALKSFGVEIPVGAGLAAAENYLLETASDG
jgi:alanine-glyoxylate transaminase/serine-glyoxylate transaminase/serine-pyruvate transaminase